MKWRVGDRVQVVFPLYEHVGKKATVVEVSSYRYRLKVDDIYDDYNQWFAKDDSVIFIGESDIIFPSI